MAAINFEQVFEKLKAEAKNLAISAVKDYKNEASADALQVIQSMKENLKTWTMELAEGKISKTDFQYLVLGQNELTQMSVLKQAGLSLVKTDEFKNSLLNLVVNTVIGIL